MRENFNTLTPDEAVKLILETEVQLEVEEIDLEDGLGRVVAEDFVAEMDVPSFDRSPYDGFAFRSVDSPKEGEEPVRLKVVEEIPAGSAPKEELGPGEAAKILTGAPVPKGADVCVKYENFEHGEDYVIIDQTFEGPKDIVAKGEDTKIGTLIVEKGTVLNPAHLGMIASQGNPKLLVYKRPVAGILVTGSELTPLGQELELGKIYNTNYPTIKGVLKNLGFDVVNFGVIDDDLDVLASKMEDALTEVDVLITTGGASVGDYDYSVRAMDEIGAEVLYWEIRMRPGGAQVVSRKGDKIILGLSGSPAAALLALFRVGLPHLKQLKGQSDVYGKKIQVILRDGLSKGSPVERLLRGHLEYDEGRVYFVENTNQGNGVVSSFNNCQALCIVPAGSDKIEENTLMDAYITEGIFE